MELLLFFFFVAAAIFLTLLSIAQFLKFHEVSKGIALFVAACLALLSALGQLFPAQLSARTSLPSFARYSCAIAAMLWSVWVVLITYTHRIEAWDEGAYMLSGMALRGFHVPYAAHRAPVTGLLCAVFVGWDRFLNPVLLGLLLVTAYFCVRRLLGPLAAALSLLVLLCQNLLLESSVDIMSELPAALLLLAGFFSLARRRLAWAGLWFAFVVFARWNLAPVWLVVFLGVLLRFGRLRAVKFLATGAGVFSAWYILTVAMGFNNPLLTVYHDNFLSGLAFSATPQERPDFLLRTDFYVKHFFFLTPPILLAVIAAPIQNWRRNLAVDRWTMLVVLPLALLSYMFTMLMMGGLFPRFMTPLIPSAVVSAIVWFSQLRDQMALTQLTLVRAAIVGLFIACAMGLWPLNAAVFARAKHRSHPVFGSPLESKLNALPRQAPLYAPPREPLSRANGHQAMVESGHLLLFPTARRDFNSNILEEPDSLGCIRDLARSTHSGDIMLIPAKYRWQLPSVTILFFDEQWAVVHHQ